MRMRGKDEEPLRGKTLPHDDLESSPPTDELKKKKPEEKNIFKRLLYRYVFKPVYAVFSQGLSAEALALSFAFGITGGLFPIPGTTSLICAVFVYFFKLNIGACQLTNFLMTPLELMCVVPFIRLGELIFFVKEPMLLSASEISSQLYHNFFESAGTLGASLLRATIAWALFTALATFILYHILKFVLTKFLPSSWLPKKKGACDQKK